MNRDIFHNVKIPVFGAPLFIISNPKMVIAQCKGGIVGSFPALNAKCKNDDSTNLGKWIKQINEELDKYNQKHPDTPAAPFAVNLIVHKSNKRLEKDVEICLFCDANLCKLKLIFQRGYNVKSSTGSNLQISL